MLILSVRVTLPYTGGGGGIGVRGAIGTCADIGLNVYICIHVCGCERLTLALALTPYWSYALPPHTQEGKERRVNSQTHSL